MADTEEGTAIQGFLTEYGGDGYGPGNDFDHAIDQTDKADDAVDYEDISDDDLEDLEVGDGAPNGASRSEDADDDFFKQIPAALGGLPLQSPQANTNGYHVDHMDRDEKEQHSGDFSDELDEVNDLFGEQNSSPEQHRAMPTNHAHPPQQRPSGLALPSKSSLALPGSATTYQHPHLRQNRAGSESMSPSSSFRDEGYSPAASFESATDDEEGLSKLEIDQRRLFRQAAKRHKGEKIDEDNQDVDLDFFYGIFPRFETNQAPNFLDLFPARPVQFKGKLPLKPPRAVPPTKLSLDLLPDQEKSFKAPVLANKSGEDHMRRDGLVYFGRGSDEADSDEDLAWSVVDENERLGGVTMQDLAVICGDWDIPSIDSDAASDIQNDVMEGGWEAEERARPTKRQKMSVLDQDLSFSLQDPQLPFEEPERATARLAKSVALDLNDPNLLIDELVPHQRRRTIRGARDRRRDGALNKSAIKRYNISNDEQYDALKENHQHKIRSTLGSMAVEHSLPAAKLQYPFYKVNLDSKAKRSFHRPQLDVRDARGRELRFQKQKHIKRKHLKGRDIKDIFAKAEDLSLGDNANVLLLEYSEEAPIMMSNFGMGSRLINYYRKRDTEDQERPKREIGETHVLLTQDKSPFANFGHVDKGEVVPTIQNVMYRAPVFQHKGQSTDFLVGLSSTYGTGHRFHLRNVENLHTVGQQFPLAEVPGQHSRKVTDAAKKRLRALSYRIYSKSIDPSRPRAKALNNENLMPHLPGHDMPQTRSKMREFMKYERAPGKEGAGVWVPMPGQVVPDSETLRSWIKPEDVCLLDSMQAGVQHLADLGMTDGKDGDDEKDVDESANIELRLAPWRTTKSFLQACQGKAMLKIHGEGDPTGRGDGFSFVKTSMKGGFQALGESVDDKLEAKKRRETGGHAYNVAKQQKLYDDDIRRIWEKQKQSLSAELEVSDTEMEDEADGPESAYPYGRGATPRSSFGTPAAFARHDDESASQFSRGSADRGEKVLTITRKTMDKYGQPTTTYEQVTNPRVIAQYRKRKMEMKLNEMRFAFSLPSITHNTCHPKHDRTREMQIVRTNSHRVPSMYEMNPTGDAEMDALMRKKMEQELLRVERNAERREAREKLKGRVANPNSPGGAGSPGQQSEANNSADGTPQKGGAGGGRGRNKDGTARKCANCGQVGHIKTNRKSVSFLCIFCSGTGFVPLRADGKFGVGCGGDDGKTALVL